MRKSDYKCINKCNAEDYRVKNKTRDAEVLLKIDFLDIAKMANFVCCPFCGALYPATIKRIREYYDIMQMPDCLNPAMKLLFLSEYESAVRDSAVVLESEIRILSNLPNLSGHELISEAFKYKCDNESVVILQPKIKINDMCNKNEINEHEGLKLMLMGFFKGSRNIYMHNKVNTKIFMTLSIISQVSYFLRVIRGESLL